MCGPPSRDGLTPIPASVTSATTIESWAAPEWRGQYEFGPAGIEDDGEWDAAGNTGNTNRVVGPSSDTGE